MNHVTSKESWYSRSAVPKTIDIYSDVHDAHQTCYYEGLEQRRAKARHHLRKIMALVEIYSPDQVARAISDGLAFEASVPSTSILEARTRARPEPGPLQLTRRQDLLDLDVAPPVWCYNLRACSTATTQEAAKAVRCIPA